MSRVLRSSGIQKKNISVSYLVIGTGDLRERISEGLHEGAKKRNIRIEVHKCESVSQILKTKSLICIDFIIFVFDSRMSLLEQIEKDLTLIDDDFIISNACCLVHGSGVLEIMGLMFHYLNEIRNKYNIRFLSANVFDPNSCMNLVQRILNLTSTVLGFESGIPIIPNLL